MDGGKLKAWMETVELAADVATSEPLARLAATLDHEHPPWRAGEMPPLAHWLYFLPHGLQSRLGEDGHPRRGGAMPPPEFPRRMWAGSRVEFLSPIPVGAAIERRSTVEAVTPKSGRSGNMLFVTLRHEISTADGLAVIEAQDIVYREAVAAGAPVAPSAAGAAAAGAEITRIVTPDPALLFRYSALTFNGHRIHYDADYARDVEGYPGLVVHGPLIATLLMDHVLRHSPGRRVRKFNFRAQRPLFDLAPFGLFLAPKPHGAAVWAAASGQPVAMSADAEFI